MFKARRRSGGPEGVPQRVAPAAPAPLPRVGQRLMALDSVSVPQF